MLGRHHPLNGPNPEPRSSLFCIGHPPSRSDLLSLAPLCYEGTESSFLSFFLFFFFIFRWRGKEGERGSVWWPLMHSLLGTWPTTQACDMTGN